MNTWFRFTYDWNLLYILKDDISMCLFIQFLYKVWILSVFILKVWMMENEMHFHHLVVFYFQRRKNKSCKNSKNNMCHLWKWCHSWIVYYKNSFTKLGIEFREILFLTELIKSRNQWKKIWNWPTGRVPSSIRTMPDLMSICKPIRNCYSLAGMSYNICCTPFHFWIDAYFHSYKIS